VSDLVPAASAVSARVALSSKMDSVATRMMNPLAQRPARDCARSYTRGGTITTSRARAPPWPVASRRRKPISSARVKSPSTLAQPGSVPNVKQREDRGR